MNKLIFTCEHASPEIPVEYADKLNIPPVVLSSHRGCDIGALHLAKWLAKEFSTDIFYGKFSRLLIDLNRSIHNPNLFSEYSKRLNPDQKKKIIDQYYNPYVADVEGYIGKLVKNSRVIHFSIHSFTPVLNGKTRNADIGILYDPKRKHEKFMARALKNNLSSLIPSLRIRFNYPYRGISDGRVTSLRKKFSPDPYVGLELEFNQNLFSTEKKTVKEFDRSKEYLQISLLKCLQVIVSRKNS